MALGVAYRGDTTETKPSPAIWGDCPWLQILSGEQAGICFHDDFVNFCSQVTTEDHVGYHSVLDATTHTIKPTNVVGGEAAFFGSTDNEESVMKLGTLSQGAPFVIPDDSSDATLGKKLWFEARVKRSVITDDKGGFFVGLAEEDACATNFIADAGNDFGDFSILGFWMLEADGDSIDIVTQKTGAPFDTIKDGAATLVADTYIKVGFVYDPNVEAAKRITFYVDGVDVGTYVGENSGDATVYLGDTTNFPGDVQMTLLASEKNAHDDDITFTMDWWRVAQLRA
jgi:hypothetical protein